MTQEQYVQTMAQWEESVDEMTPEIERYYAEWLMDQPEAMVCNGDMLIQRMEQQWGWDEFLRWLKHETLR